MKKFIVLYHADESSAKKMAEATPESMQEGMKAWKDWAEKCGDGLVDMGSPLSGGQKVTTSGVTPSDKKVVGYSVLQADDMEKAVEMLKGHPHLDWVDSCEVEIHEAMPLPGM